MCDKIECKIRLVKNSFSKNKEKKKKKIVLKFDYRADMNDI